MIVLLCFTWFTQQKKPEVFHLDGGTLSQNLPQLFHGHKMGKKTRLEKTRLYHNKRPCPGIQLEVSEKSWAPQIIQKNPSFHFGDFETIVLRILHFNIFQQTPIENCSFSRHGVCCAQMTLAALKWKVGRSFLVSVVCSSPLIYWCVAPTTYFVFLTTAEDPEYLVVLYVTSQ